jgi:hypothetical protein
MYDFSKKLKLWAIGFMVVGAIGIVVGFMAAPSSVEEVKEMLAHEASHGGGHGSHDDATNEQNDSHGSTNHEESNGHDNDHANKHHDADHEAEHILGQLQNKPWSALYVACFFFMMISLGALAFYAVNRAAQAGWSPLLFRVMEGITSYLPVGLIFLLIILAISTVGHGNHLFAWMHADLDPTSPNYDKLIDGKKGWLNGGWFMVRAVIFSSLWIAYQIISKKLSRAQDTSSDNSNFKKNFKLSAAFLVVFLYSESIMSWDWIMSIDPHWYSTLFGWYLFASMFVSGITVIALVTIFLKSGDVDYLPKVNNSHIYDLAKFMFGISIFWTYLWFSQFMLIWYADIPEEVTYYVTRIQDYNLPFFGMVALNFLFPMLVLMNSDFKRVNWFVVIAGIFILAGHYMDIYNMVMPGTVGTQWSIGLPEISSILFFLGLFIYVIFTALTKAPLEPKRNPFIHESEHFHY